MKTPSILLIVVLAAVTVTADEVAPGAGVQVGDVCSGQNAPPPRPGLICRPAFVTIDGDLREEWEYDNGHVLNARKGDAILSPGSGLIGNLLKKVTPAQKYSHAGIMVEDRYRIRHSTASVERMLANGDGNPPGTDGLLENALRFAWPGTITEFTDEAFEGSLVQDPESGIFYHMQSFNSTPLETGSNGDLIPDTVLKPPPLVDADLANGARARLDFAGAAAEGIEGHYRFFGYSQPNEVLFTPISNAGWANGTVGSVCSAFVWRAMKDINMTLEGTTLEPEDVQNGAQVDAQTPDGLYVYTETERRAAAEWLYGKIYDQAAEEAGGWDIFFDAADDAGNQIVNCFGFDWCGETFTQPAAQAGCDPDDDRAQDSPCWNNEGPGVGRAISPDNLMFWDKAPDGPYGYREPLQYAPAGYFRVFRWGPADGTATVQGTVTDGGSAAPAYTYVQVEGLSAVDIVDASGAYEIEAVPGGPWTLRACGQAGRGDAAIVNVPLSGTIDQDLALEPGCGAAPDPGKWRRQVHVHGTVTIVDTEDFSSDEIDIWTFDETAVLEPNTPENPETAHAQINWERCTGNEVLVKFRLELDLDQHNRSVKVQAFSKMFEGASCDNDDLDDSTNKNPTVAEDSSTPLTYSMDNEEWNSEDTVQVNLSIDNAVAP